MSINIHSRGKYPGSALSNFASYSFVVDGVECSSMEGFLQSLKFQDPKIQRDVCKLVGMAAKKRGSGKNWQKTQTLWWKGVEINRHGDVYQTLLDKAFESLAENKEFANALRETGDETLTHNIGKKIPSETVLTQTEFLFRLYYERAKLKFQDHGRGYWSLETTKVKLT